MKINPGIKAYAIIVLIALLIPISINWFTFLARTISDDNETPDTSREHTDILGKNEASDTSKAKEIITQDLSNIFTIEAKEKIKNGEIKLSQVFRNFLLTEKFRLHNKLNDSLSIVIAPKENISNKEDEAQLIASINEEFKYKFQVITLESFVDAIISEFPQELIFLAFRHRHLDFSIAEWFIENKINTKQIGYNDAF